MQERIVYIDYLRGFAILLVLIGHIISRCYGDDYLCSPLLRFILAFWMPVFVFISGYVSYKVSYGAVFAFVKKKAITLLSPFLCMGLIYTIWREENISDFFYSSLKSGYWFTFVLFEMTMIFYLSNRLSRYVYNSSIYLNICFLIFSPYIILLIAYYLLPVSIVDMLSLKEMIRLYIFFAIGALLRKFPLTYEWLIQNNVIYTFSLLLFSILIYQIHYTDEVLPISMGVRTVVALSAVFVLFHLFRLIKDENIITRCLSLLGRYSLDIYLLHYFFLPDDVDFFSIESSGLIYDLWFAAAFALPIAICCLLLSRTIRQSNLLSLFLLGKLEKKK